MAPVARRLTLSTLVLLIAASCGGSPTAPGQAPPLGEGQFLLNVSGGYFECRENGVPTPNTSVDLLVTGTHDASGNWIGRAKTPAEGEFEIRMARTQTQTVRAGSFQLVLSVDTIGSVSGTMKSTYVYVPTSVPNGSSVSFPAGSTLTGSVSGPGLTYAHGQFTGPVSFKVPGFAENATCQPGTVGWTLNGPMK